MKVVRHELQSVAVRFFHWLQQEQKLSVRVTEVSFGLLHFYWSFRIQKNQLLPCVYMNVSYKTNELVEHHHWNFADFCQFPLEMKQWFCSHYWYWTKFWNSLPASSQKLPVRLLFTGNLYTTLCTSPSSWGKWNRGTNVCVWRVPSHSAYFTIPLERASVIF